MAAATPERSGGGRRRCGRRRHAGVTVVGADHAARRPRAARGPRARSPRGRQSPLRACTTSGVAGPMARLRPSSSFTDSAPRPRTGRRSSALSASATASSRPTSTVSRWRASVERHGGPISPRSGRSSPSMRAPVSVGSPVRRSSSRASGTARSRSRARRRSGATSPARARTSCPARATAVLTGWPTLKPGFYAWCLAFGVFQTLSTLALSKALKLAEISLVTSLWKVSLLILLGMAWVTIGEHPSALGVAGVLLSAGGVYLLNVTRAHISPWEPLRVLVTDRGQRYTLVAALFYAPSVITIKQAILASNTAAGTFGTYLADSLIMTPLALTTSARHFPAVPRYCKHFLALGVFAALTTLTQGTA